MAIDKNYIITKRLAFGLKVTGPYALLAPESASKSTHAGSQSHHHLELHQHPIIHWVDFIIAKDTFPLTRHKNLQLHIVMDKYHISQLLFLYGILSIHEQHRGQTPPELKFQCAHIVLAKNLNCQQLQLGIPFLVFRQPEYCHQSLKVRILKLKSMSGLT